MKRPIQLIIVIFLVITALCIVRIAIENSISTTGIELVKLQTQTEAYRKENSLLREQYLQDSSFEHIASLAAQVGFVQSRDQANLSAPLPLAYKSTQTR